MTGTGTMANGHGAKMLRYQMMKQPFFHLKLKIKQYVHSKVSYKMHTYTYVYGAKCYFCNDKL